MWLGLGIRITNWWRRAANGPFNNHATLTNGLVSYWKLDEQSGTRYDSITATGNDLTDNNTVTYVNAGPTGVAAQFTNGNTESLSKVAVLDLSAGFTVAAWVATDRVGTGPNFVPFSADNRTIEFQVSSNIPRILVHTSTGFFTESQNGAFDTGLHLWSAKFTGTELYTGWDGIWQAGPTSVTGTLTATDVLRLGYQATISSDGTGTVGRVGLWSSAINDTTLLSLYNAGVGKSYSDLTAAEKTGLVSYWNLGEASGTRADSHGSNTLTDNNTVTSATNDAPPPKNAAAFFTVANSESLSKSSLADPGATWTIAGWAYTASGSGNLGLFSFMTSPATDRMRLSVQSNALYHVVGGSFPTAQTFSDGVWHQFIAWADNSSIYIQLDNGTAASAVVVITAGTNLLKIGLANGNSWYWGGAVDEVGYWNRVLTAQERADLWNSGDGLYYGSTGIDVTPYFLLQEDGSSKILLENGTDFLLRN